MNTILNDESHALNTSIVNLSPSIERRELHDVASCIVMSIKDVFWEMVFQEKNTNSATQQLEECTTEVSTDDNISLYRLGSSAIFRMKKLAWKKIKCRLVPKFTKAAMKKRLEIIAVLEETDKEKIPEFIYQNRNLFVMKEGLLPAIRQFSLEFHKSVNHSTYTRYGKDVYKVAVTQLVNNKDLEKSMASTMTEMGVKTKDTILFKFIKDLMQKLFNTRCKAFLKSITIMHEESTSKSSDKDTMLRQKLKVL